MHPQPIPSNTKFWICQHFSSLYLILWDSGLDEYVTNLALLYVLLQKQTMCDTWQWHHHPCSCTIVFKWLPWISVCSPMSLCWIVIYEETLFSFILNNCGASRAPCVPFPLAERYLRMFLKANIRFDLLLFSSSQFTGGVSTVSFFQAREPRSCSIKFVTNLKTLLIDIIGVKKHSRAPHFWKKRWIKTWADGEWCSQAPCFTSDVL